MIEKDIEVCNCVHQGDHSKGLDYFQKGYYAINGRFEWKHIRNVLARWKPFGIKVAGAVVGVLAIWFIGSVLFSLN